MIVHHRKIYGVWRTFAKRWVPFDNQMLDLMHESYWIVPRRSQRARTHFARPTCWIAGNITQTPKEPG